MHLSGFWAANWPILGFIALLILAFIGAFHFDKPGRKTDVLWALSALVMVGSFVMAIAWGCFIGINHQTAQLRQQARATYGIQLTEDQSYRLIEGADAEVTLHQEGTRATVQKVHLIKEQDTNRWLLQTRGPVHVKHVPLRTELHRIN